ncbi:pilus assembly FimT family protein [Vreelandella sp. TE19]
MQPSAPRQTGFTLFELLAVIVLVSIAVAVLSGGLGRGLQAAQERSAVTAMMTALSRARVQAISSGQPVRATFDLSARQVVLPEKRSTAWPDTLEVQLHTAKNLGAAFEFYPDGASTGGHIEIKRGQAQWRIDIAWLTGRATLTALP